MARLECAIIVPERSATVNQSGGSRVVRKLSDRLYFPVSRQSGIAQPKSPALLKTRIDPVSKILISPAARPDRSRFLRSERNCLSSSLWTVGYQTERFFWRSDWETRSTGLRQGRRRNDSYSDILMARTQHDAVRRIVSCPFGIANQGGFA